MNRIKRDCLRALGEDWFLERSAGKAQMVFRHKPTGRHVRCGPSPGRHDNAVRSVVKRARLALSPPDARSSAAPAAPSPRS